LTAATLSKTLLTSIPPQLVPMLKTLRLGGMQDTLPLRLAHAQQQRLGYLEFLELLLGDEIERRANRALAELPSDYGRRTLHGRVAPQRAHHARTRSGCRHATNVFVQGT
jgi:hypothetical protein